MEFTEIDDGFLNENDSITYIPKIGMEFDSEEAAYDFYNEYGRRMGFSIRKEYFNINKKTGELTLRKFTCSKEGFRPIDKRDQTMKKHRAETRTGCKAYMSILLDRTVGKFKVSNFTSDHNHPLHLPECVHMMPSQRNISKVQAIEIELADDSGLNPKEIHDLMSTKHGGREILGYTRLDQKNYLRTKQKRDLKYGKAGSILHYFQKQTFENPSFYYALQMDAEEKIVNFFWADAKMIIDYDQFGDVVTFDTTYKTNKEYRPFGVFIGFNHHRETVIFGAALLYDETTASLEWLFDTFLEAMSRKKPQTIFTDQDQAMAKAISIVMPETYHRLCIWHMMENGVKHLQGLFGGEDGIEKILKRCIYDCEEEEIFHACWFSMLDHYNVHNNSWLQSIYDIKEKWAKPFVKKTFSAKMNSTQLSESLNSTLKKYLKVDHDVVQFFKHFERVVKDKRYKENEAEYHLREKLPNLKMCAPMLKQAATMYTRTIFSEFQVEYERFFSAFVKRSNESDIGTEYVVGIYGLEKEYLVNGSISENLVDCNCGKFETFGILCCHAIKVLDIMNVKLIPERYIMKRWTKIAIEGCVQDFDGGEIQPNPHLKAERYSFVCLKYVKLIAQSVECEETYLKLIQCYKEMSKEIDEILKNRTMVKGASNGEDHLQKSNPTTVVGLKRKNVHQKGKSRYKSCLEKKSKKKRTTRKNSTHDVISSVAQNSSSAANTQMLPPGYTVHQGVEIPASVAWMAYDNFDLETPINGNFTEMLTGSINNVPYQGSQLSDIVENNQV